MTSDINSLQQLLALSDQLAQCQQEQQSKNHPLTDVFIKTSALGNQFEPRKRTGFARIRQELERLIFSKKYDLAENLKQIQGFFEKAQEIKPSEFGKIQATNSDDIQDKVNGFANKLDTIRARAKEILAERASKESSPKKKAALLAQIARLEEIAFKPLNVEEQLEGRLKDKLQHHIDEKASALLCVSSSSARKDSLDTFVNTVHSDLGPGVRIKNLGKIKVDFARAVEAKRVGLIREHTTRFQEALKQPDSLLLDTICTESSFDERRNILERAFIAKEQTLLPPGFVVDKRSAHLSAFVRKFEKERAVVVKEKIANFAAEMDAKVGALFDRMPSLDLNDVIQEFTSFVDTHAPPGISAEDLKIECGPRIKQLEERMSKELKGRAIDALGKAKTDVAKALVATENAESQKEALAAHIQAFSILRRSILENSDLPADEKEQFLKELLGAENQIIQLAAQGKTITVANPSAPLQIGDGNTLNITNITGCPTPLAGKVSGVANSYFRDSIMRATAYIAMEIMLKGTVSVLSWPFMLSLIAPHIAVYVTNKVCEQLPASVGAWVKPLGSTLGTLLLIRCSIPYLGRTMYRIGAALTPIALTSLNLTEPFTERLPAPGTVTVSGLFNETSDAILTSGSSQSLPVFGPSAFAALTPAAPVPVTQSDIQPMQGLNVTDFSAPANPLPANPFTPIYGLRSNEILGGPISEPRVTREEVIPPAAPPESIPPADETVVKKVMNMFWDVVRITGNLALKGANPPIPGQGGASTPGIAQKSPEVPGSSPGLKERQSA